MEKKTINQELIVNSSVDILQRKMQCNTTYMLDTNMSVCSGTCWRRKGCSQVCQQVQETGRFYMWQGEKQKLVLLHAKNTCLEVSFLHPQHLKKMKSFVLEYKKLDTLILHYVSSHLDFLFSEHRRAQHSQDRRHNMRHSLSLYICPKRSFTFLIQLLRHFYRNVHLLHVKTEL